MDEQFLTSFFEEKAKLEETKFDFEIMNIMLMSGALGMQFGEHGAERRRRGWEKKHKNLTTWQTWLLNQGLVKCVSGCLIIYKKVPSKTDISIIPKR